MRRLTDNTLRYNQDMSAPGHHNYPPPQAPQPKTPWWKQPVIIALSAGLLGIILGATITPSPVDGLPAPAMTITITAEPEPGPTVTVTAEARPVPTVTVTAGETDSPDPDPQPASADETESPIQEDADDLGQRVLEAIDEGMPGGRVAWALPITDIETISSGTVRVHYQESLTDADKIQLGQYVFNFANTAAPELGTIVIRDTSGIDFNVYCGATICSDSTRNIDR